MLKRAVFLLAILVAITAVHIGPVNSAPHATEYGSLPLNFVANQGQMDKKAKFYAKGEGHSIYFTQEGIYLRLIQRNPTAKSQEVLKLSFLNGNENPRLVADNPQVCKFNSYVGNDPARWRTGIPTYGAVVYEDVYENIDVRFYGTNHRLEYDVIVKKGGDPNAVKLRYQGARGLKVNAAGELVASLAHGRLTQKAPYLYQEKGGKRIPVQGSFKQIDADSFGFEVASYDKQRPLVIDPVIEYSSFLGGDIWDYGWAIAIDSQGNAYITGQTDSDDFPEYEGTSAEFYYQVFVAKYSPTGARQYVTVLGSVANNITWDDSERGEAIAVDSEGYAHITGVTPITGVLEGQFPTTTNAFQDLHSGNLDAFYTSLTPGGGIAFSTLIGGIGYDKGLGIAVDDNRDVYIAGVTASTDFPTRSPFQPDMGSNYDAFLMKIDFDSNEYPARTVAYASYLGGDGSDYCYDIDLDSSGNIYLTGDTSSSDFPGTATSAIQSTKSSGSDVFVAKIDTNGSGVDWATYLGSTRNDRGRAIAVDNSGNAYITGYIENTMTVPSNYNFPLVSEIQDQLLGGEEAFVTKVNAAGEAIVFSTFLGGSGGDRGYGIAVDSSNSAYVAGGTVSSDFPIVTPIDGQDTLRGVGNWAGFITRINPAGDGFIYSTYFGSSGSETIRDIAADDSGNAYITGVTYSTTLPAAPRPPDDGPRFINKDDCIIPGCETRNDAFIARISDSGGVPNAPEINVVPTSLNFHNVTTGETSSPLQVTLSNIGSDDLSISSIALETGSDYSVAEGGASPCSGLSPTIAAGENCTVEVVFIPLTLGVRTDTLRISSNDTDEPVVAVDLTGWGATASSSEISVSPLMLDFHDVLVGDTSSPLEVTISNTGGRVLDITEIFLNTDLNQDLPGKGFSFETGGSRPCADLEPSISTGDNCTIEVTFTPHTVASDLEDTLVIYSDDPDQPITNIPLSGNGVAVPAPNIQIEPRTYDFGDVLLAASSLVEVAIMNTGTLDLVVSDISLGGGTDYSVATGGASACASFSPTIPPASECTVEVTFSPQSVSSGITDALNIASNDAADPMMAIALSGNGLNNIVAPITSATGTGVITMDTSANAGTTFSDVETFIENDADINQNNKPVNLSFPDGLISFVVSGVTPGDTATVTLTFPNQIPQGAQYYKVDAAGFYVFANAVISGNTVVLTLTDDGTRAGGDSNGTANDGFIHDPGGLAVPDQTTTQGGGSGSSGGGCFIDSLSVF